MKYYFVSCVYGSRNNNSHRNAVIKEVGDELNLEAAERSLFFANEQHLPVHITSFQEVSEAFYIVNISRDPEVIRRDRKSK